MPHPADRLPPDDSSLVLAMTQGDTAAMSTLYDRYAPGLLGLALRITREQADAEEVVVDTFAQAWRDAARFETGRGTVAAWLVTIARSRALDLMRARSRRGRLTDAAEVETASPPAMGGGFASPMAGVLADERARRIRDALLALPDAQREALELAYFEGLSQSEIAERLDQPLGTVKTRLRLGLRKMRDLVAALGPGGY
ncbi:MAG: sigma-70 family RNA polymerase sigma factor [Gemmatimonadales bacterium]|nr:sigma-70 family RNA polymerase sigma factor [Gemmatimonadales bacterium]